MNPININFKQKFLKSVFSQEEQYLPIRNNSLNLKFNIGYDCFFKFLNLVEELSKQTDTIIKNVNKKGEK
jgi:hypothetical protein